MKLIHFVILSSLLLNLVLAVHEESKHHADDEEIFKAEDLYHGPTDPALFDVIRSARVSHYFAKGKDPESSTDVSMQFYTLRKNNKDEEEPRGYFELHTKCNVTNVDVSDVKEPMDIKCQLAFHNDFSEGFRDRLSMEFTYDPSKDVAESVSSAKCLDQY